MSIAPQTPDGYATVNPMFIVSDADDFIAFVKAVFGGDDRPDARTIDVDGLLLHAEVVFGGGTLMFAERKPGWPFLPHLQQIYVDNVPGVLARAVERGATVVTEPTDMFGTVFSRLLDPWGNLWWVYQHGDMPDMEWEADGDAGDSEAPEEWTDPNLAYIHRTLVEVAPSLGNDPRAPRP